jgi:hypothetical protein
VYGGITLQPGLEEAGAAADSLTMYPATPILSVAASVIEISNLPAVAGMLNIVIAGATVSGGVTVVVALLPVETLPEPSLAQA